MHAIPASANPRIRLAVLGAVLLAASATLSPAHAQLLGHGPVLAFGYSPDEDASDTPQDLGLIELGWRWRWEGADAIDDFLAKGRIDFSWAVEPIVGVVFGDAEAFEISAVPYVHLRPLGWEGVVPYFEFGIGLAYTGLRNYGLGSRVHFSDNAGIGVTFGSGEGRRWSVGYRFRHLSHLGLFGDSNDGLNVHFLTLSVE
ncbi:MAG: acyloxyacyl hydrolase [Candidatus Binatia bacterium]